MTLGVCTTSLGDHVQLVAWEMSMFLAQNWHMDIAQSWHKKVTNKCL